ncbi:MAG: serine protease, partial [Ruminococcaceae bacterium]|nr:serine protease [Oscillospiraceae bacterium]
FHNIDGTTVSTETLHSMESEYYEDEISQGFKKPYKDGYSFAAFIPKEGTDLFEYIESLDGEKLGTMLDSFVKADVSATLPSFMYEYDIELSDILKELGVVRAFSSVESDLSGIGEHDDGNLSVSRVIHKTFIELTADGTRAAAVTAVEVECEGMITYEDLKTVDLDRPFIYMIIDDTNNIPVFVGTITVL